MISFFVPMVPEPKQSDRTRIVEGNGKRFIHHYQPAKVRRFADQIAVFCAQHRPDKPFEGPVGLSLVFVFPWLKRHGKKIRAQGHVWCDVKPDMDNLEKQVCDALQKTAFFVNDSRIAFKSSFKAWGDKPGICVTVFELATFKPLDAPPPTEAEPVCAER